MQKKILKLLSINCRYSNKDIAKSVGVSADTVDYQIKKMIEKDKLGEFYVYFNYGMIGYKHQHYLVRLKDPDSVDLVALKKLNEVTFINTGYGKHDLQIIVIGQNRTALEESIKKVEEILGDNIQDFKTLDFSAQYKWTNILPDFSVSVRKPKNQKNIIYSLDRENFFSPATFGSIELDELDHKIIKQLLKNPRISYLKLARNINSSHETVRYRITNYIKKGFIENFGVLFHFHKFGYFTNYTLLKLKNYDSAAFSSFVDSKKYIMYSARLSGECNCIVYTWSKTPEDFGNQLREIRAQLKDSLIDYDVIYYGEVLKNVQFPEEVLKEKGNKKKN